MGRSPSFEKGLKKGPWTSEEDRKLVAYIEQHGHGSWRALPLNAGLQRCGKSCRLRWTNYLRPDIKRGKFNLQEEQTIIQLHALLGNRWSSIATYLPKRTNNEIKNYWNTHLKKRLTRMGIDPITHKSRTALNTNLSHMTQWENARLEAESRLVSGSRGVSSFYQRIHCGPGPLASKSLVSSRSLSVAQPRSPDVLKTWHGITLSKLSNLSGFETPNDQSMSVMNLVKNDEASTLKTITMKDHVNNSEISKGLFNIPENPKDEGNQDTVHISDMFCQDNYLTEVFTNSLVNDGINENFHGDYDDDNNYWSNILDKLGNDSSVSSIF